MKRISDLKVPELHDELTKRGLSKKGKKQELINVSIAWVIESLFLCGREHGRICVGVI